MSDDPAAHEAVAATRPRGLLTAAAVTGAEGVALTGFGAWLAYETVVAKASNERVATGSAVYFLVLGPLVLLVAAALWRRRGWASGAALFVQLLAVPVAVSMWQEGFVAGAVPLLAAAAAAAFGLLQPTTRHALGRE